MEKMLQETAVGMNKDPAASTGPESAALAAGGIAALLAGACCVVPFVLVSIGMGGAWLANLQLLEPYRLVFIGIAIVALGFAWKRIYRPAQACEPGPACVVPKVKRANKIGIWMVAVLFLVVLTYPY